MAHCDDPVLTLTRQVVVHLEVRFLSLRHGLHGIHCLLDATGGEGCGLQQHVQLVPGKGKEGGGGETMWGYEEERSVMDAHTLENKHSHTHTHTHTRTHPPTQAHANPPTHAHIMFLCRCLKPPSTFTLIGWPGDLLTRTFHKTPDRSLTCHPRIGTATPRIGSCACA